MSIFLDPAFSPRFQWPLFAIGLVAGSFEEVGWTGFAAPRLLHRQRLFVAGLWLGLIWALWHELVDFRQNSAAMRSLWLLEFAVFYVGALTAYRMLMTWVYANTLSLLLAVLMHASYTGWLFVLYPATSLEQGLVWQTGFTVALWVAVAVVMTGVRVAGLGFRRSARTRPMPSARPHETARKLRIRSPVLHSKCSPDESRPRAAHARTQTKSAQLLRKFAATIEPNFARQR